MSSSSFQFTDRIVIRTPRYPFQKDHDVDTIDGLLIDPEFMEAIYVASPVLHKAALNLKAGAISSEKEAQKIRYSLSKYYSRMYSRSTPFGLFSACTVANWSSKGSKLSFSGNDLRKHARLDMYYLCNVAENLLQLPFIKNRLEYYPNSSLYNVGGELRYVEYHAEGAHRKYELTAVKYNDHIKSLITHCQQGSGFEELSSVLVSRGLDKAAANKLLDDIIAAQLLTSGLEPQLTGTEYLIQLISALERIQYPSDPRIDNLIAKLKTLDQEISKLKDPDHAGLDTYTTILAVVNELGLPFEESKLIQIDSFRSLSSPPALDDAIQAGILESLSLLNRLQYGSAKESAELKIFKNKFNEKYEGKSVPLLEALDPDFGIGYPANKPTKTSPLADDIQLPKGTPNKTRFNFNNTEMLLHAELVVAQSQREKIIDLEQYDRKSKSQDELELPPSLSAIFRVIDQHSGTISLESFSGPSAVNLISRFAHGDEEIKALAEEIVAKEEQQNNGVLLCEFLHLPESRASNVILHPKFRRYEMPYLAASSASKSDVITLSDVFLKIDNGELIMFSKDLDKVIVPRLSHVHNHFTRTLPLYHFIGDYQRHALRSDLGFTWGALTSLFSYFPRVTFRNVILSPAIWHFDADLLPDNFEAIGAWRKEQGIPDMILHSEGDNELLVDLTNALSTTVWLSAARSKKKIVLKEFLFRNKPHEDTYVTQCIAPIINTKMVYRDTRIDRESSLQPIQRKFFTGDEWLYYKLYCSPASSDMLLGRPILSLIKKLQSEDTLSNWFFVKYNDPDHHIRLRMKIKDPDAVGHIICTVNNALRPLLDGGYLFKVQTDTYVREIERYGGQSIIAAEEIFGKDSDAAINLLNMLKGGQKEKLRWLWCMKSVDCFLNAAGLDLTQKEELLNRLYSGFGNEFGLDKSLKVQIDTKFRTYKKDIHEVMDLPLERAASPMLQLIAERDHRIYPLLQQLSTMHKLGCLQVEWHFLLGSLLHMQLNRVFNQKARLQEMMMYAFIIKHYNYLRSKKEVFSTSVNAPPQ